MAMKKLSSLLLILVLLGSISCNKDETNSQSEQLAIDTDLINNYLTENDLTAKMHSSGLQYIISKEGNGIHPNSSSTVTVQYSGYLLDGTKFDSGTATFPLSGVIQGWQVGIPLFKKGGRGQLFIPSYMGYGASGSSNIPANAPLIFDVYLISFQ